MTTPAVVETAHEALLRLNRDYIDSVQNGDVRRFDEILADDFRCSNPDGSLVDRRGFLEQTARPVTISNLQSHDVEIRMFSDVAIIHARTSYMLPDGRPGFGRYTDVWARIGGSCHSRGTLKGMMLAMRNLAASLAPAAPGKIAPYKPLVPGGKKRQTVASAATSVVLPKAHRPHGS